METFLNNLKRQAEENPMAALVIGTAVIGAIAKFIDAGSATVGRAAYAKQVAKSTTHLNK